MPEQKDKWFTFLMAVCVALLCGLGTMVLFLNSQTWTKLDRITALFLHERDLLNHDMKEVCKDNAHIKERLTAVETKYGNGDKK